jgi:hypothetical protein
MIYVRSRLPVLLPSYLTVTTNINYNLIRLCSICLMFFSQVISSSSSSKSDERALTIVKSIDDYLCENYVFTCFFRQRYHKLFDNQQQTDKCKSLLILHSCLHYDTDTTRMCSQSTLKQPKSNLNRETPPDCFTSSLYKTIYAQHLRSIAPSRTAAKYQIFAFFLLFISFVIKIRACC